MGPPLGTGSPGRRVSVPVSFSHRRVGSSILASLSEAGGNDLQKVTSKPLPPRSFLFATRHLKRVHTLPQCTNRANGASKTSPLVNHPFSSSWPNPTQAVSASKSTAEFSLELLQI